MTRIGPALDVIAAATTPDERARGRARGATARPRPMTKALPAYGGTHYIEDAKQDNGLPTR